MSYILDALRRADSERERGAVPSLHSKQIEAGVADADDGDDGPGRSAQPLWWAVGGLSLALVAMAAWLLLGRSAAEPEPARSAPPVAMVPVLPSPAPAPAPAQQQGAVTDAAPVPPPVVTQAPPPPVERKSVVSPAATAPTRTAAAPKPAAKPAEPPQPAATPAARDDDAPVPSISELPDDIRRQLPALSVSGASYSKNPASRMLILNGQVFKEGDKVANDLVLEQIRLKSAVLSFRGRRYAVNF